MRSKSILFMAVAAALQSVAAGIWDYARPDSDALVYLDVGRAEKAMDRDLWEKLEADKKAAQERDAKSSKDEEDGVEDGFDFMRGFADLNPELVANVTLVSRSPLRLMVEGAVRFQSGGAADAKKSLDGFVEMFSGEDGAEPMSLAVKETDGGMYEFLLLFNLRRKVDLPAPSPSPGRRRMADMFLASKPSAFLAANSVRWAPLIMGGAESRSLRRMMVLADSIGLSVAVKGRSVSVLSEALFNREGDAAAYAQSAEAMCRDVEKILSGGSILRKVSPSSSGRSVGFSVEVDIGESWSVFKSLLDGADRSGEG